jgi:hypothetical protein
MPKQVGKLLQNKRWYRNLTTVLALVVAIGAAYGTIGGGFDATKKFMQGFLWNWPEDGTEIVLDRSAVMDSPFEPNLTKMAVAQGVLANNSTLISNATSLAFREFGGSCDEGITQLTLGFAKDTADRMRSILKERLNTKGEGSLFMALSKAVEDFDGDRFKGKRKRIIVIWGGGVDCRKDSVNSMKEIGDMLQRKKSEDSLFSPDLRFIGELCT